MIPDEDIRSIIAQITLYTSTSAEYCYGLPLEDLFQLYNDLRVESMKARGSNGKPKGT